MVRMLRTKPYSAMAWPLMEWPFSCTATVRFGDAKILIGNTNGIEFLDTGLKLKRFGEARYVVVLPRFGVVFVNKVF